MNTFAFILLTLTYGNVSGCFTLSVIFESVKVKFSQKCRDDPKIISHENLEITLLEKKQSPKITLQSVV